MDKLAQLQATLRDIERGTRLEQVDTILVRQILQQPLPRNQKPTVAQSQQKYAVEGLKSTGQRQAEEATRFGDIENVSGKDAYRALLAIRKKRKNDEEDKLRAQQDDVRKESDQRNDESKRSPVPVVPLNRSPKRKNGKLAEPHPDPPNAFTLQSSQDKVDDHSTGRNMRDAIEARKRELLLSQLQVEEATTELQTLLTQSQSFLPSQFIFERNLKDFCQERSIDVIQHVLLRFQNRFYKLYFAQWRVVTLELRRIAHQRAAVIMSRVYRGHRARKHAHRLRKMIAERQLQADKLLDFRIKYRVHQALKIQMVWRRFLRSQAIQERQKRKESALYLQKLFRNQRLKKNRLVTTFLHLKSIRAAIRIQKVYRGHRVRVAVRNRVRREKREKLVAAILARNVSNEALIQWKMDRQGAAFVICKRALYPFAVKRRLWKLIYLTRRLLAAQIIARRVCTWFGVSARRQAAADQKLQKWLQVLAIEQERTRAAAIQIQKNLRRWVQQRKYIMNQTRVRKLARRRRIAEKNIKFQSGKRFGRNGASSTISAASVQSNTKQKGAPKLVNALKSIAHNDSKRVETTDDFAKKIQRCYRRHAQHIHFMQRHWRKEARNVEARVLQRRQGAICIQSQVRGMQARTVFRRMKAEKRLHSFILKWKWYKVAKYVQAAKKIQRWLKQKRTQRFAHFWTLERRKQFAMATRLQKWVRQKLLFRCRISTLLSKVRKQEETQLFCQESLRVCIQHLTDEIIFDSLRHPFEDAMKFYLYPQKMKAGKPQPSKRSAATSAPSYPIMQMVFLVVSGAKDIAKWKDVDFEKTLSQIKLDRSRVVALFKAVNKHYQETAGNSKTKPGNSKAGSPKAKSKAATATFFSMTDVDVALAKAGGASKRALTFGEFGHVLRLMGEIKLTRVTIWWSKYDGSDAQLFALLWKFLFVLPDLRPLVQLLSAYVMEVMNTRCQIIQRLFQRESNLKHGLLLRLQMRQQLEKEAKVRAVTRLQAHARSFLAKKQHRMRMQQVYEKYVDPEWGLPYWVNPKTGYSTWEKPRVLRAEDVSTEVVPYPAKNVMLKIHCNGKPECDRCAEWFCYDCDECFCVMCLPTFHKGDKLTKQESEDNGNVDKNSGESDTESMDQQNLSASATASGIEELQKSKQPHEMEQIPLCGLCQFQVASRKCLTCLPKSGLKKKNSLVRQKSTTPVSENGEREALFCDVCFAFTHRRGGLEASHKSNVLLEMCTACMESSNDDDDDDLNNSSTPITKLSKLEAAAYAVQWECGHCEKKHKNRVCGKCVSTRHPVELCGEVKRVRLQTLRMIARTKQIADEIEARDRADIEKIRQRALQALRERCALKLQRFWRAQVRILHAKHIIEKLKRTKHEHWLQLKADAKKEKQFVYLLRNFFGIAKPLESDTAVRKRLREMNALQRRQLTIRARMFSLLPHEYMRVGIPLPGIGRAVPDSKEIDTTEDLRGWIKNRQTLRLKRITIDQSMKKKKTEKMLANLSAWYHLAHWSSEEKEDDILVNIDAKEKLTERSIPLAQFVYFKESGKGQSTDDKADEENEEVEYMFVMYLVEYSMDPKRIVWVNHSLAERFWAWKRLKTIERREKREAVKQNKARAATETASVRAPSSDATAPSGAAANTPSTNAEPMAIDAKPTENEPASQEITPNEGNAYPPANNADPGAACGYDYSGSSMYYNTYEYGCGFNGYDNGYYNNAEITTGGEEQPTWIAAPLVDSSEYFYSADGNSTAWQGYEYDQSAYAYDKNTGIANYAGTAATDPYGYSADPDAWNGYDTSAQQQYPEPAYASPVAASASYGYEVETGDWNVSPSDQQSYAANDPTTAYQNAVNFGNYSYEAYNSAWSGDAAAIYASAQYNSTPYYYEAEAVASSSNVQDAWEEVFDPQSQQVYYVNRITQETVWQIPATY